VTPQVPDVSGLGALLEGAEGCAAGLVELAARRVRRERVIVFVDWRRVLAGPLPVAHPLS